MSPMSESKGFNPVRFATEVRQEARKVTWTTWRETLITTIMVFIMVTLAAIFFFLVDLALNAIVRFGFSIGS
jgi:preprotein translocase subunit SecE